MFGLNVTHQVIVTNEEARKLREIGNETAAAFDEMLSAFHKPYQERYGFEGAALHDPCTVAYLLDPGIFSFRSMNVNVDTNSGISYGRTVHDIWGLTKEPQNTNVAVSVSPHEFFTLMRNRFARLK